MPNDDRWRRDRERRSYESDPWANEGGREDFGSGRSENRGRGATEGFGYGDGYEGRSSQRFSRGSGEYSREDRPGRRGPGSGGEDRPEDGAGNDYYAGFYGADQNYGRPSRSRAGEGDRENRERFYGGRGEAPGAYGPTPYGRRGGARVYGRDEGERGRQLGGDRDERGFFERAGDEIASWFGDDDADRRRRADARQGDEGAQHHRGRGPRGYQRSDERIREDVNDHLTEDPHLDASDIEVTVSGREVTLSGTVESRFAKRHAEDIADSVSGVTHVQNNLRVRPRSTGLDTGDGGATAF